MEPLAFRPRLWELPAATATKSALGAGTLHWPLLLYPHPTIEPLGG
jgi:hypothetical protein